MARFVMVCSSLVAGDAVGNDILQMAQLLQADGHEVSFAAKTNLLPELKVWTLGECQTRLTAEHILIYHHCVNLPEAVTLFREHRGTRILRYHNVTPPELLRPYNEEIARGCELGREETLALLSFRPEAIWADSAYNLQELQAAGVPGAESAVIPPFHLIDELQQVAADTTLAASLAEGRKNILTVGRIVPNKGPHRLIEALGVMRAQGRPLPRLHVVGKITPGLENYALSLSLRAKELGVAEDFKIHVSVSLGGLRALYENCHLFAIASDHEGFCVPLVEAMSFGLPIVAHVAAAVPETLGDAGLMWPTQDARVWAATFARVLSDESLSTELSERGRRRYRENFAPGKIAAVFRQAVQQLRLKS
jgi:glycosyltransferase involved in cell wall biosynthesis